MQVIRTLEELRARAAERGRDAGLGGVLVPTMGALHEGHAALIREGTELAARRHAPSGCRVSIFVNPTQFNERADYERYPRTEGADLDICRACGAGTVFIPEPEVMYPPGSPVTVPPMPPAATEPGLEDAHRPGHFAGVCQVVMRLFDLLRPDAALFGEKDWQQLCVIRQMTEAARLPIEIIAAPTVRAPDGLALSSRNRFLSPGEREQAVAISQSLTRAARERSTADADTAMREHLRAAGIEPEYAVVRDAATLGPISVRGQGRALIAARVGPVRLIDNAPWPG